MSDVSGSSIFFAASDKPLPNARLCDGWHRREPHGCWAIGAESTIVLPPARYPGEHRMVMDLRAFTAPGHIDRQRLFVSVNGHLVGSHELAGDVTIRAEVRIPETTLRYDGPNLISFSHPDFGVPKTFFETSDTRPLSIMFHRISFYDATGGAVGFPAGETRTLFIVTGACRAGVAPNLELVKFLYSDECEILLWIDFENAAEFEPVRNAIRLLYPRVEVRAAPKALWGGASIVLSMLRALAYANEKIDNWSQAIFTSIHDFPLMQREKIIDYLKEFCLYDFCSSRWVGQKDDVMAANQSIINREDLAQDYDLHKYRPDINIRVSKQLIDISPREFIFNGMITKTLRDRYRISVYENFCTSTLTLAPMTPYRAQEREEFFENFELIAGRMWIFCSRYFARMLISNESNDIFQAGFRDVLIPDECFFQSMAEFYSKKKQITAMWKGLQYKNANPSVVDERWYRTILEEAGPGEIFARKAVNLRDYRELLAGSGVATVA